MVLRLAAPAKLNLYLHVTGRRPRDGYHLLDGLVAFANIGDVLTIAPAPSLRFTVDGPFADALGSDIESNLVVRAARAMAAVAGREAALALHLTKNLPVASGIGGGSADAAACIRGLAQLWGLHLSAPAVRGVAETLGSDLPVCVAGRAAFIGGIGADLAPSPSLPPAGVLLVNPGTGLPTPSVYRARAGAFTPAMRFTETPADAADLARFLADRRNDLQPAAIALAPAIAIVLDAIAALPECRLARMSGSGATCFGLFATPVDAALGAAIIAREQPCWWTAAGRLLDDADTLEFGALDQE